jgi:hypothetical protein
MLRAMLAVLRPGLLETQVAGWAYWVAKELGSEENGWDVMVTAGEANRTLIGKALNREIHPGDYVHLGVAPKRDGLNACVRRSVIAVEDLAGVSSAQRFWFDFVEEAYRVGEEAYRRVAAEGLPARLQEQALVDFFAVHSDEVSRRYGRRIELERLKPYTGTHKSRRRRRGDWASSGRARPTPAGSVTPFSGVPTAIAATRAWPRRCAGA